MRNLLILFISLFNLLSCSNKKDNSDQSNTINKKEQNFNSNIHQEDLDGIFTTPEDSMSVDQKEMRNKLITLMKESIKVKDGRLINNSTKKDFEKQEISLTYYYLFQESIDDLNTAIEKEGVDAQKVYNEMMEGFSEQ